MATQSRHDAPTVLLTRPAAQGARFADALRGRFGDLRIVVSPMLAPRFLSPALPANPPAGLVFTSETGVEGYLKLSSAGPVPAWCVGPRTAEAARQAGFRAIDGGGDARRLVAAIVASGERGPLLHPRGEDQAVDIVALLAAEGVEAREVVVYAQDAQPLNKDARDVLAGNVPVILPIFSPRTARILAASAGMRDRNSPLWIAALSPQIAEAARALAPQRMVIAAEPDAASLLGAMQDWFDPGRQP